MPLPLTSFFCVSLFDLRTVSSSQPAQVQRRRAQLPSRLSVATRSPRSLRF
jgi:hypothetical protein